MHVIDRVMSPLDSEDNAAISSTASSGPLTTPTGALGSATASASTAASSSSSALAAPIVINTSSWLWTVLAILGGIVA